MSDSSSPSGNSIKERFSSQSSTNFTCPHYQAIPGSKRCYGYSDGGVCDVPGQFMCIEWLKANGHPVPPAEQPQPKPEAEGVTVPEPSAAPATAIQPDLFGHQPTPVHATTPLRSGQIETSTHTAPESQPKAEMKFPPILIRDVTSEEIASFKELGVEICIASKALGDVWIVPEYTGKPRKEISIEHVMTLVAICVAFPGSTVTEFNKRCHQEIPADDTASTTTDTETTEKGIQ